MQIFNKRTDDFYACAGNLGDWFKGIRVRYRVQSCQEKQIVKIRGTGESWAAPGIRWEEGRASFPAPRYRPNVATDIEWQAFYRLFAMMIAEELGDHIGSRLIITRWSMPRIGRRLMWFEFKSTGAPRSS